VIAIGIVWAFFAVPLPRSLGGWGMPLTLVLVILDLVLGALTGWLAFARTTSLDERQAMLRDRAYRLAFRLILLGLIVIVLGMVAGYSADISNTHTPPAKVFGSRWIIALVELLAALPTIVIAWLQPDSVDDSGDQSRSLRHWLPLISVPAFVSVWLIVIGTLPVQASETRDDAGFTSASATCAHFIATRNVGYGFGADVRLDVEACWDGTHAYSEHVFSGLTRCSVEPGTDDFARVTELRCTEYTDSNGTMRYKVHATVRSGLVPAVTRDVTLELDVTRDGKVLAFG